MSKKNPITIIKLTKEKKKNTFSLKKKVLIRLSWFWFSLSVCQLPHLYCDENYVPLMTPPISDKPPFVGLSPQFSFTGGCVEKVLALCFPLPWVQTADTYIIELKRLNISYWSWSTGLQSPLSGENMCCRTHKMTKLKYERGQADMVLRYRYKILNTPLNDSITNNR